MPTALELRELDDEELENRLSEYRREMLNLRFQLATGQLDNVTRLSVVRKDVARVLTVLRDREIAGVFTFENPPIFLNCNLMAPPDPLLIFNSWGDRSTKGNRNVDPDQDCARRRGSHPNCC